MKQIIKHTLKIITIVAAFATLTAGQALAATNPVQEGIEAVRADGMPTELIGDDGIFHRISNIAFAVIGAISVIMLAWGGLRYILSGGDSKKITDAKNTILYAIIGLAIAWLSYAIVSFILTSIGAVTAA